METITSSTSSHPTPPYESVATTMPKAQPLGLQELRKRKQIKARLFSFGISLLLLLLTCVIGLYAYIAWVLGRPEVAPLQSNPLEAVKLPYEDVQFYSANGKSLLNGWYIPAAQPTDSTIIFSHGYGGNREEIWVPIYELASNAHQLGYNVLMFDYGYVYNTDRVVTGGAKESLDLIGAVEYTKTKGTEKTIIWGFSMGAGTALQATLQTDSISAMILDSTFVLEPDTLVYNLKKHFDLPREPSLTLLHWLYPLVNGSGMDDVPYRQIKETAYDLPILFIHGTMDERSPYENIREIALNQKEPSDSWFVPGATHELVYRAEKEQYMERAITFLNRVAPAGEPQTIASF